MQKRKPATVPTPALPSLRTSSVVINGFCPEFVRQLREKLAVLVDGRSQDGSSRLFSERDVHKVGSYEKYRLTPLAQAIVAHLLDQLKCDIFGLIQGENQIFASKDHIELLLRTTDKFLEDIVL